MKINNPLCFKTFSRAPSILVERIEFNQDSPIELGLNESAHIEFTLYPSNASNREVDWSVSPDINGAFEIIQNGNSFTINTSSYEGTYELIVTSVDNGAASTSIIINIVDDAIYATNISISPSSVTIKQGESAIFTATVTPSNAVNVNNIQWQTNAPSEAVTLIESTGKTVTVSVSSIAELTTYTITCRITSGSPNVVAEAAFTIVKASSSEEEIEEHRSTWRGTDLLSSGHFSDIDEIADAVAAGDFSDIWVGDYFTINGPIFEEATIKTYENYHLVVMDINNLKDSSIYRPVSSNHITLMPEKIIGIASQFQNRASIYDNNNFIYSTLLPVYWQTYKAILGENHLLSFSDTLPGSESEIDFEFSGVTIPSIRCITNNFNNINVLPMSNAFYNILPGFSLKTEGINKSIANSLAQFMFIKIYIVSDLNNTNGYRIAIMGGKPTSNQSLGNGFIVGVCPLIVFGSEQKS